MRRVIVALFLILFSFGICLIVLNSIKIRKIICQSQNGDCNSNVKNQISAINEKNIFKSWLMLDTTLKRNKNIVKYSINLNLPYDLKVDIIEKTPDVAFKLQNGNFSLIDINGTILDEVKETSLPKILTSIVLTSDQLAFTTSLMSSLFTFYNINEGKITSDGLVINNLASKSVIFPLTGDKDVLLGSLNLILSRLRDSQEASTIGTIDLRFKNPVLR